MFVSRSPNSGLYSQFQKYKLPYPEAIFDIDFYNQNPKPFLDLAKAIYPGAGNIKPNIGHFFVRLLETKGKLLRMYTQNIDGLERCNYDNL
jgi:NAD-dependent SIR2 family protein deacetylase